VWVVAVEATLSDHSKKQERARAEKEQLRAEREEEIASDKLRLSRLKLPADWEGRPHKIPDNDGGVSLLRAIRRIVAKGCERIRQAV
jgi:hypothetical protein